VIREATPGVYLDGEQLGEILLPNRYVPRGTIAGEMIEVFVHFDSQDRLVATTETPDARVGDFAFLRVVSVNPRLGAFLDWGLSKDLLLPDREQARPVRTGDWVVAHVFIDPKSGRIVASTRLNRFLDRAAPAFREGQAVQLLVYDETDMGFKAIVDQTHTGLLYHTDLAAPLSIGQSTPGYIRRVREDGKIDLGLDPAGYQRVASVADKVRAALEANGGRLAYNDESSPEEIRAAFGVSKKAFKQAIGALYRDEVIRIEAHGIRLVAPTAKRT
jgi:hypothetical protein